MALVVIGMLAIMAYALLNAAHGGQQGQKGVQAGGIVLIGPIPVIFGTSGGAALAAAIVGLVIFMIAIVFFFFLSR